MQHPTVAYEAARLRLTRLAVDEKQSVERAFARATELIARTLGVERVGIWLFENGRRQLRCVCLYQLSLGSHHAGELLRTVDFPTYVAALEERRAIVADDARTHPLTREFASGYLEPHGITSMIDAPLFQHGEVVGVVCHEHVGPPRTWTETETGFVASVADIVALILEQAAHIDARAALEQQTQRIDKDRRMASLGRVAAAVGHDFSNLLGIVLGRAQAILDVAGLPAAAAEHARTVVEAVKRAGELTRQLAELGRPRPRPPEPSALDEVVGAAGDILRAMARKGQRVEIDLGARTARVGLDRSELERVLLNLVSNAIDATAAGSTVRVATAAVDGTDAPYAVLEVTDDGAGIDDATRPHIFEPYFTTKQEGRGCGLGLAIVHAIVQRAQGFIEVESAPGRGTTFTVHLPAARDG